MCRLFGMSGGSEPVGATFWLLEAPDSLAVQSRREPDGTGLGYFDRHDRPVLEKQPLAAYADEAFAREAREVHSRTFVAHIRYASTGAVALQNTHPFEQAGRLFAHNGVLGDLPRLEQELGPAMAAVHGETDSERFFALITREIEASGDVGEGIVRAAGWVADNLPVYALNIILISDRELWALRYPDVHELHVLERAPGGPAGGRHLDHASARGSVRVRSGELARRAAVVVASEPMDEDPGWQAMESGELLHVDPQLQRAPPPRARPPAGAPAHAGRARSAGRRVAVADRAGHVSTALQRPPGAAGAHAGPRRLPPAPPLPRLVQTVAFASGSVRFLHWCRRRYGGAVFLRTLFDDGFVMVFDPALVKEVFQGQSAQLHAGEANELLGPILGHRSVLLLDGAEHLRHRRLLLGPFHGERMRAWTRTMLDATDREIDRWPVGREFALLESMQAITLAVIVEAVFGLGPGPAADELTVALRAMIEPLARPRGLMLVAALSRLGSVLALSRRVRRTPDAMQRFAARRAAVDALIEAEIARRRADPHLDQRDDVFSTLLCARDETGSGLSDAEVRDELLTLLLAGHETTATGLAWTFDLLLHNPAVLARARGGEERYLDAVAREALRLRPVIPAVGRIVRGEPFRLGRFEIPEGVEINPSIRTIHTRPDLYPEPLAFRPERFLGEDAPDTYTWVPFGGGARRCLGASFALLEMRLVLGRVLERAGGVLSAARPELERARLRTITLGPRDGVRVRLSGPVAARRRGGRASLGRRG